jgi:magnesium-transporting ATPase (P-type)
VTGFGIWRTLFVGTALVAFTLSIFFWMKAQGAADPLARTAAVNAITLGQVFYLLNSRYLLDSSLTVRVLTGNPYLWHGITAVIVLQLLFTYAPPLQAVFDTRALPASAWLWLVGGAFLLFLVVEGEKLIMRSRLRVSGEPGAGAPYR